MYLGIPTYSDIANAEALREQYILHKGMIFILRHGGKIKVLSVYILYVVSYSSNTIRHHYVRNTAVSPDLSLGLIIWFPLSMYRKNEKSYFIFGWQK